MNVPDRETAYTITWMTDMLLTHGQHTLPPGLTAALRHHKTTFLTACATQPWAQPGHRARYAKLADHLARQITSGHLKPGQRLPSPHHLATTCHEHHDTASRALHILAIRGQIAMEAGAYYVLPAPPRLATRRPLTDQRENYSHAVKGDSPPRATTCQSNGRSSTSARTQDTRSG